MKTFLATVLLLTTSAAHAQRDTQSLPFADLAGAARHVSCIPDNSCTFWVRLPPEMQSASLVSSAESKSGLWAPLEVVTLNDDQISRLVRPGPARQFLGKSFHGVHFQASPEHCKELELWATSSLESDVEFVQAPLSAWLNAER